MPEINSEVIKDNFKDSKDVLVRPFWVNDHITLSIFCVDGLIGTTLFDQCILRPIATDKDIAACKTQEEAFELLFHHGAYHAFASETDSYDLTLQCALSGMGILIFDELKKALIFDVRAFDKRGVSEPSDEGVLKGAKDSFIEVMRTNTALIRRRVKSPNLVMEQLNIGEVSKTDVTIAYLRDMVSKKLVDEVKKSIQKIQVKNISTPAFIEEYLIENKYSLFPQVMYTQRPDRCSANLSEGRVAIIIDGIPFVYIVPCQLPMLMQSPEDYAQNCFVSSFFRVLRYLSLVLTLLVPGLYIAVTMYQNQLLPVELALAIQKSKEGVPFSSSAEVFILLISFEIIIEAGLRLPKTVGQAMSIVSGLIVGQAAVTAQIVSPAVVIVVAFTTLAGFTLPNQDLSNAVRITRFGIAILSAIAGFYGLVIGVLLLLVHLCSMNNYGVAYLSPFVDVRTGRRGNTLLRYPVRFLKNKRKVYVNEK